MNDVLIIDDEERTKATVLRLELIHNLKVDIADSPAEGLKKARSQKYKVIILDIMMTVMDVEFDELSSAGVKNKYGLKTGLILLRNLLDDPGLSKGFKAVFFSARNRGDLEKEFAELKLVEGKEYTRFFRKPIDTSLLFEEVQKHLN